jgi:integral membrane protein
MSLPEYQAETDSSTRDGVDPYQAPATGADKEVPQSNLRRIVDRVRIVGMAEGVSWLLLLAAMPLKYQFGNPMGVKIMGPIHGALFVLLLCVIFQAWEKKALSFGKAVMVFIASLIPFGPFFINHSLAKGTPEES